jgi:hypothetical protein
MSMRWLGASIALAAALIAQNAAAQSFNSCPEGQAVQGSDASGKHISCVAIPDVSGLQGQINAERAAREGMDVVLQDAIDELRPTSIVGTYSFTGTQTCLNSSLGFNADLSPTEAPSAPPPPGVPLVSALVQPTSATVAGTRTFNIDGTGVSEFQTNSTVAPGFFYNAFAAGVTNGGATFRPSGNASVVVSSGTFTWEVVGGKLIIHESGAPGVITQGGGPRAGWTVFVENVPPFVGVLGKDLRNIAVTHADVAVEINVLRSPDGLTELRTPRICHRERTLRRM